MKKLIETTAKKVAKEENRDYLEVLSDIQSGAAIKGRTDIIRAVAELKTVILKERGLI